jgi:mannosyltransferase OCH1-like enzyme
VKLWTDEEHDFSGFKLNNIIADKELNPGLRADALRLEILYNYGGIYLDTDMALV